MNPPGGCTWALARVDAQGERYCPPPMQAILAGSSPLHLVPTSTEQREAARGFTPQMPESLDASGLSPAFVEEHVLRCLYGAPQITGSQLAATCGLGFQAGIGAILDSLRQDHQVEIRGQRGIGEAGYAYVLTSKGTSRALEAQEKTPYRGTLPVPIAAY